MLETFIYAPVSTLFGIIVLIGCIYAFDWFGLISLIFILPMIKKDAIKSKHHQEMIQNKDNNKNSDFI